MWLRAFGILISASIKKQLSMLKFIKEVLPYYPEYQEEN